MKIKINVLFFIVVVFIVIASAIEILAIIHGEDGKSLALTLAILSGTIGYILKWITELDRRKWENNHIKKDGKNE